MDRYSKDDKHGQPGHTSTHLSRVLIKTLAVVTLTEDSRHQTSVVPVVTHAATTVTGACHTQEEWV